MANEKRLIDANALQFEPDENCIANGVLIWGGRSGGKTMTTVLSALKKMVDNAPTVDAVEVVHGRWIELPSMEPDYKCSECGRSYAWWEPSEAHYCPNFGAKMDGERKDNV